MKQIMGREPNSAPPSLETIPLPLSLAEALERRIVKLRELNEPETVAPTAAPSPLPTPALPSLPPPSPPPAVASTSSATPAPRAPKPQRPKGKARDTRHTNGSAHANTAPENTAIPSISDVLPPQTNAKSTPVASAIPATQTTVSAPPAPPRRQSLREPKPRRRPDEQGEPPSKPTPAKSTPALKPQAPPKSGSAQKPVHPKTGSGKRSQAHAPSEAPASAPASAPPSRRISKPSARRSSLRASTAQNGTAHVENGSAVISETPSAPAPHLPPEYVEAHALPEQQRSSSKFTGDSGHTEDGRADGRLLSNGKRSMSDNPGRTIYSQHRQSNP